jgi:transcriptional regulator with XRE-family HTH domain
MTQGDLEVATGFDKRAISRYEKEESTPSVEAAAKLAKAVSVSLDELTGLAAESPDKELENLCLKCMELPDEDREALKRVVGRVVEG